MGGLWPLTSGGRQRSFHILSELAKAHSVVVLTSHGALDDPDGLQSALGGSARVESFPFAAPKQGSLAFAAALARSWASSLPAELWKWQHAGVRARVEAIAHAKAADIAICDFMVSAPNVPADLGIPIVYFSHNVEHMIWRRLRDAESRTLRRRLIDIESRKMARAEAVVCGTSAATLAVSAEDCRTLQALAPAARIAPIPTGVDTTYFSPDRSVEREDHLVFSGSMDWYPNEDAVVHFADDVLPLIQRTRPGVTFSIVGRAPSLRVRELASRPGVEVTGTVDDVRPHVRAGAVQVVPLRIGGGTRLKIYEALAMGQAVVSTTIGAEGLDIESHRHIELADDPSAMSAIVLDLLNDAARRHALGDAGRELVVSRYGWPQVAREFEAQLTAVVASHRGQRPNLRTVKLSNPGTPERRNSGTIAEVLP